MALLPQNQYGNTQAQNERRRKLAESLLEQNQQAPQGQMVGGVFVAPSWTQYLAKGLNQYNARKEMSNADKSEMDLQRQKQEAIAALLKPQEQTGENPLETRTPEQVQNEKRMKLYQAVSQFGADPSLQLALEDMNYQRNRGDKRADIQDERGYQGTIRAEDRGNKLADVADQRAYEDLVRKENQGFQLTQQERGFKQQFEMQKQSQGFQAGQNALNRNFQAGQNQLTREQQEKLAGVKAANANPSEGERKAATLLSRLQFSENQLKNAIQESPQSAKPNLMAQGLKTIGLDALGNAATPEKRQQVEAAQLDILDAALTLGTGAAYTKEQLEGYRKSYFPQIGDDPKTIQDKQARLSNVIEAAKIASGRAAPTQLPQSSPKVRTVDW